MKTEELNTRVSDVQALIKKHLTQTPNLRNHIVISKRSPALTGDSFEPAGRHADTKPYERQKICQFVQRCQYKGHIC